MTGTTQRKFFELEPRKKANFARHMRRIQEISNSMLRSSGSQDQTGYFLAQLFILLVSLRHIKELRGY
jgi:hypothetical protein